MSEAEKKQKKTAIVVGAGAGGIATAARLAKAGYAVTVLEKNAHTGGRCSLLHDGAGHRFDQGPSLLLLPRLFRETFADLGTTPEAEGVELLRCPSNYRVWFADGGDFELTGDTARMRAQIERVEGAAGFDRYLAWLREAHEHYELSVRCVLHRNFTALRQLAHPAFVAAGLRLHPLHSVWGRASRYFWSERLRRVFTFATMYMGMSPFDAPGTYSLLPYTELAEGIWYPRGGFHAILAALVRLGERLGVEYRLGAAVAQVTTHADGRTARGVRLADGEELEADVVVVNADLVYAYSNLFPKSAGVASYAEGLRARDGSCSSISFYWSLDRVVPELQTHNIFLADDYRGSFDDIFKRQTLPREPSFYLNVPSRVDPSAAPPGRDSLIALVPVGHLLKSAGFSSSSDASTTAGGLPRDQDWPALVARARAAVLSAVAARVPGVGDLGPHIAHEMVNDPAAWEARFNLDKGCILGLSHSFFNVLAFRPRTRARGLRNAYFVGASTHPGTGVPIVLAGARITCDQILADAGVPAPWPPYCGEDERVGGADIGDNGRPVKDLDRLQPPAVVGLGTYALLLVLLVAGLAMYQPLIRSLLPSGPQSDPAVEKNALNASGFNVDGSLHEPGL
ncbi:phytoene dehydrogenase [Xylariaceae sp. FL0804]|nr:phytoene dehydrogenase [Xylariaceae sp. FL0804]